MLTSIVSDKIEVRLLPETKIEETFPLDQFLFPGLEKPFMLDKDFRGGSIVLLIRNNIPFRLLKSELVLSDTEALFFEINLRKNK